MGAGGMDARMFSLFVAGGAGVLLIIVGTLVLLLQRIVQQDGQTEVQLPFGVRLTTNYPALILALLGAFLAGMPAYYTLQEPKAPGLDRLAISGQVGTDRRDVGGDLLLGLTPKLDFISELGHQERKVEFEVIGFPGGIGYTMVGIVNWDDGKKDIAFSPLTLDENRKTGKFEMRFRGRP
jgi:hypothetical protein